MPVNNISLTVPNEYTAEAEAIARKRRLAEALQAQSMQPIERFSSGGIEAPISWTQGLAKMLQAYSANKGQEAATAEQKALAARFRSEGQEDVGKFMGALQGTPASSENIVDEQANGGMGAPATINAPAVPGDRQKALAVALQSQNPMVQGAGSSILSEMLKTKAPIKVGQNDRLIDPTSMQPVYTPPPVPKYHIVNGNMVPEPTAPGQEVKPVYTATDKNKPFNPDGTPNRAYQQYEFGKAGAGATRVQTNVNAFTPASEEAQRDFIKSTRTTYDQLKQAPVAIESIEKAKALIPAAKGFMGPGGETLLGAAKFLNNRVGTNINTEGVKNAEELRTRIFFNIMDNLKKMDAQPSQMQQQIMMESLGKLGTDPNALPNILDAYAEVMKDKVKLHNTEVQGAITRGVKFPYDPFIQMGKSKSVLRFDAQGNQIP